jgi:glutathione peroxidase
MTATVLAAAALATDPSVGIGSFQMKDIEGKDVALSSYKGKVLLVVNVASKCGHTPQYAGLQDLYTKKQASGFEVLGFPANDFLWQEPGTDAEIHQFCSAKYNVTFPMFSKIHVKGDEIAPLYKWLTSQKTSPEGAGKISWNFEKFVIGRDGLVAGRFAPSTLPEDPKVLALIESELAKPIPSETPAP